MLGSTFRPYWWDRPVVEGLGRAIIEVAPNRARFDLAFVETDAKSDEAMKKAVQRSKIAYDAIKKVAGDKARVTTSVNVNAYYKQYRDKEGTVQTNQRADQVEGYEARVSMTVLLTDPSLAGRARAAALALGPQDMNPIYIFLEQTTEMQRRALDEAAKDARARAQLSATAAGARLGDLLVVQEGSDSCMGGWSSGQVARVLGGDNYNYSANAPYPPPPPPPPSAAVAGRFGSGGTAADHDFGTGSCRARPAERCESADDAGERVHDLDAGEMSAMLAARRLDLAANFDQTPRPGSTSFRIRPMKRRYENQIAIADQPELLGCDCMEG